MSTTKNIGRTVGVLLIAQMLGGVILANAAANSLQVSWSVLIGIGTGALSVGIADAHADGPGPLGSGAVADGKGPQGRQRWLRAEARSIT